MRELAPLLESALRLAQEGVPGPVFLECPVDLLYPEALVREWYGAKSPTGARASRPVPRPGTSAATSSACSRPALPRRRARRIPCRRSPSLTRPGSAAPRSCWPAPQRPLLLVGSQALLGATGAARLAADVRALGVPVYLSGMARGLLGAADPLQLRHRRKQALREADLVLLAGVPADFRLDYGRQISRKARARRRPIAARASSRSTAGPTLAIAGAPELALAGIAAAVGPGPRWQPWLAALRARDAARDGEIARDAAGPGDGGLNPLALCTAVDAALATDSVIVADGGDFVATASYVLRPRAPLGWLDPGVFGTLGVGAGFALGAKLVRPDADVWVLYGDGSFGYSLAEADTFARHGLGIVAVIGNDAAWTQIAREQIEVLRDDVGTVLASSDYERAAEGLGACGRRLEAGDDVAAGLAEARAVARGGRPVYVNARIGRTAFRKGSISM